MFPCKLPSLYVDKVLIILFSRWDSSDPDRAPPPLPMNPSSPSVASRPNTSSAIKSAHAALTEKARESNYITNPPPKRIEPSPERSLIRGAAHKRMQSLQTGSVRDLSNLLEGGSSFGSPTPSPERNVTRPATPHTNKDFLLEGRSPEKSPEKSSEKDRSRASTPTSDRKTPTVRASLRRPPQSILGENTPPQSATMLALQHIATRDADSPLSNVTNGSNALVRAPQTFDAISNQILSLTSIATSLQREMAQLSRRSKDNATDLVSLKEATNSRDEDIRQSLRELLTNLSGSSSRNSSSIYGSGSLYLDNKAHNAPEPRGKFSLPRIPSPNSFSASLDRDFVANPSTFGPDGAVVSIALLEKILREMGTKDGQENLTAKLTEVAEQLNREGMSTAKKLEDLVQFIKTNNDSQALVAHGGGGARNSKPRNFSFEDPPRLELDFDHPRTGPMTQRVEALLGQGGNKENRGPNATRASNIINEDILKIIRTVKDSVAQGGGLTAEVKAMVRDLRGEVLGMGRKISRELDEQVKSKDAASRDATKHKEDVAHVIQSGLEELKQHMDRIMRESRRQSSSSTVSRNTVDYNEIFQAMRAAISEKNREPMLPGLEKEDIIEAVKEAWENYKPDIELQHFGLERDELLECLKEGIQQYAPQDTSRDIGGATREEVFTAVVEGLKHFSPPRVETEASLSREEILDAVRECLEEFEFPSAPLPEPREPEITRDDMLDAVREGLHSFDFAANTKAISRDVGIDNLTRDDLLAAVKASLEEAPLQMDPYGEQIVERLHEIMDAMRTEFKAVSDEAKQNVAAHGRDTEQVLDATKDGLEKLRTDIESYVDRAADVTGKDEILDTIRETSIALRLDLETLLSKGPSSSLEAVQGEIEHLRETMANSLVRGGSNVDKNEIMEALRDGLDNLRAHTETPRGSNESMFSGTGEILDALQDGLSGLRGEVEKINTKPVDMTVNYEILDTLKEGLEGVRADIDRLRESGHGERAVAEITDNAVIATENLKRNDIQQLEVLITQLSIKVEAMESMVPPAEVSPGSLSKEDLARVEEKLEKMKESVADILEREPPVDVEGVKKEDVEAIETLLRNTKAKIDEMDPERAMRDHLDAVEILMHETKEGINELKDHLEDVSKKDEINVIETVLRDMMGALEELKERAVKDSEDLEKVTKTDIEAVEAICLDVKGSIEQMVLSDIAGLAAKDDVRNLMGMVKEFKDRIETHAETNVKSFEERQAETVGVGERVTEVKAFLEEFRDAIREKLEEGTSSIEALGKLLEGMGETIGNNATATDDIKALAEAMKEEFEKSNAGVVGVKLEADEKFQQTQNAFTAKMDEKFHELMTKYDDAQMAAEAKEKLGEEKNSDAEAAILGTKAVAEELKLVIDALGITLADSVEKMDEASKTVFNRVEETFTRVEENHADSKTEHQLTRDELLKAANVIEGVDGHLKEYHPKILESIKDVLLIVGQHYEHSKASDTEIREKIAERPIPPPPDETPLLKEAPVQEKYDDTPVHQKLDKLVDHMHVAGKSFAQLDMLDKIHQQVMETAAEVSQFVSTQTQRIANDHEDKEKAIEAAGIALQKRLTQKDEVEATVVGLREEEQCLRDSVSVLKAEQDDLAHQKLRLSADVSSLETALRIRREELHAMEARAEGLERRILEGVIDHSRALLISKSNKGREAMSRKRTPSQATSFTGSISSPAMSTASISTQSAVGMAMSGNRAMVNIPVNNPAGAANGRRILSLSQINHNVPTGGIKRSHSVKNVGGAGAMRKTSWGGSLSKRYGDLNKENLALKESEEEENGSNSGNESDGETMRRSSQAATVLSSTTGTSMSESVIDEGTEWTGSVDGSHDEGESEGPPEDPNQVVLFREGVEAA